MPPVALYGLGEFRVTSEAQAGSQVIGTATTQVMFENEQYIVLNTAHHVGNYFWKDIRVTFPYGFKNKLIQADGREGAEGGPPFDESHWRILSVSSRDPIRAVIMAKPKGYDQLIVPPEYGVLQAIKTPPKVGEHFYAGGFAADQGNKLVFTELIFRGALSADQMPKAGIPMYEFEGHCSFGLSGAAIWRPSEGRVAAVLSMGATIKDKSRTWGIPYAENQPIGRILQVLKP